MSEDIKVTDGTVLESLNNKVDLDGGNYVGSPLEEYIHQHCGGGLELFDTILKDHILTYEESKGLALQGTYVYKEAIAGSRYGYADFYNKVVEEYQNSSNTKQWIKSNVNYVGSVKDNQGVLSGFSTSNYATLPNRFAPTASDTWEVVLKINRLSTNDGGLLGYNSTGLFNFNIANSKLCLHLSTVTNSWNIGEITGQTTLSTNTDYWVKVTFDGSSYQIFLSTDGDLYTIEGTLTSSSVPVYPTTTMLGICNTFAHNGIIDLNESYININGSRWWTGVDNLEYKKNPNGHFFYDISEKDKVDEYFNINGTAWFYGVDTENERVFLPRNNYFDQATGDIAEVGKSVEAGLPNITGSFGTVEDFNDYSQYDKGAFYKMQQSSGHGSGSGEDSEWIGFDASLSNPIYGNSDTVQPNAVKKLLYICVGNTESTSSVTDVVEVTTTKNDTIPLGYHFYQAGAQPSLSYLKSDGQWNDGNVYTTFYNEFVQKIGQAFAGGNVVEYTSEYTDYDLVINQDDMTFRLPLLDGSEDLPNYNNSTTIDTGFIANVNGFVSLAITSKTGTDDVLINNQRVSRQYCSADATFPQFIFMKKGDVITWEATIYEEPLFFEAQGNGSLYFKVANAVQNLELLNVGEVMEAVADKISRQDCKAYITETYVNGTSWYRVYSDGWCEQGGVVNSNSDAAYIVTLLKPYINTNYEVFITRKTTKDHSGNISGRWQQVYNLTTDTFTTWGLYSSYPEAFWRTCGYIA